MKKLNIICLLILCSFSLKSQINGEIISDTSNIKIIRVWGSHYERGFAYGSLLGSETTIMFNNYLKPLFGSYYSNARDIITGKQDIKIDSIFEVEAKAIISGMDNAGTNLANMDYVDLLVCNSFLDVSKLMG